MSALADTRNYKFSWNLLGDIQLGRPNMGPQTRIEVYRLMQFTFRDVVERRYGTSAADEIFYEAGKLAGEEFYRNVIGRIQSPDEFFRKVESALKDLGIGLLRVEQADVAAGHFVLTVSEDLDCSGLPELDYEICVYDEGFIAALLEQFSGRKFTVKEIDCWATGGRTCRFDAKAVN